MIIFLVALCIILVILLILVAGVRPESHFVSTDELERLKSTGNEKAATILRREALLPSVEAILQLLTAVILVVLAYTLVGTFGWLWGSVVAVVCALEYATIARLTSISHLSERVYMHYEPLLLNAASRYKNGPFRYLQKAHAPRRIIHRVDSIQELHYLLEKTDALSERDKVLVTHTLAFNTSQVSDIMTPKGKIKAVSRKELLGPLVLDDLHKTGYEAFPVIDESLDATLGILSIEQLLTVDSGKRSTTADKMMDNRIVTVRPTKSLMHLLNLFKDTHARMIIVKNNSDETVGIVTLTDIIKALTGQG